MKNANLKVIRNDGEVVEVNKNLYEILQKLPLPLPKMNLSSDQKFWYKHFGQMLIDSKKLTKPDLIHLHSLAKSVDYYVQAENEISKRGYIGGLVQSFASGASNVSGHVTLREKMLKEIDNASKHFGFSFKDRMKLNENSEPTVQLSLFEKEMLAKNG
jgi:phage terminase small subunit